VKALQILDLVMFCLVIAFFVLAVSRGLGVMTGEQRALGSGAWMIFSLQYLAYVFNETFFKTAIAPMLMVWSYLFLRYYLIESYLNLQDTENL